MLNRQVDMVAATWEAKVAITEHQADDQVMLLWPEDEALLVFSQRFTSEPFHSRSRLTFPRYCPDGGVRSSQGFTDISQVLSA
jgi:hypothetical protein